MRKGQAIIGIDIGTTSTKSVAFGMDGEMLGSFSVEYPLLRDRPGWAEQEPDAILEAVLESVRGAIGARGLDGSGVAALGMSSAMHSLIAVDAGGRPLTRSITWADGRSEGEARRIRASGEGPGVYRRTGTPIHPMSPLPKLIWLRENRPDVWSETAKFVSIKEYVAFRLFGEWVVDHAIASATGLLDLEALDWDEEALRIAGIDRERLSALRPATYRLQGMDVALAGRMGLRRDTPFFLGGSDGALANVGVGAIGPGEMAVTIGTSAAVRMMTDRPLTDERQRTFCYHVADTAYVIGGATNNGGIALQWIREAFFGADAKTEEVLEAASRVAAGADGLLFLPYLTGERAPIYTSEARGTYFGAHLGHKREHFARAGLEGVMLAIASVAGALRDLAGEAREVRASGGFARSPLWKQMLADALGKEVQVPKVTEASALASAALAMQGLGELGNWREVKAWIPIAERLEPNARNAERYRELLAIHEELRGRLSGSFAAITEFQRKHAEG
ncbi:gluconokinase [Cohnella suwonensis]|uniref:Gluconokinase n=1 Tax=Cohnella suwonensis TaxID=696072 RepID=A0ABW0M177_9BACL